MIVVMQILKSLKSVSKRGINLSITILFASLFWIISKRNDDRGDGNLKEFEKCFEKGDESFER